MSLTRKTQPIIHPSIKQHSNTQRIIDKVIFRTEGDHMYCYRKSSNLNDNLYVSP